MKTFTFAPVPTLPDLETIQTEQGRLYKSPGGIFLPSVTTFLSKFDKPHLKKWEERVGKDEAEKVRNEAASRGTVFHSLMEGYLLNKYQDKSQLLEGFFPDEASMLKEMMPLLDNVDNVAYIEQALWSETVGLAGRVDLVAEWKGIPSIIDFKTAGRPKRIDWIEDYFLQTTCYSLMLEELVGIKARQLVILIYVDHHEPQVFEVNRADYVPLLAKKINEFRRMK